MYINGFVVPVPEGSKAAYKDMAEKFWAIAKEHGALSQMEAWELDVPDGQVTDMRRAVALEPGEKVVFSWIVWPDKGTADASHAKIMDDPRAADFGEMPFDGKRMIFGGFEPLLDVKAGAAS